MKATVVVIFFYLFIQQSMLPAQAKEGTPGSLLIHKEQEFSEPRYNDELFPMNTIFFEALGSGIIGSVNYERMITNSVGVRVGYGAAIPLLVNYYIGEKYRFELGAGVTHVPHGASFLNLGPDGTTLMTMTLGHKYQPLESGFMLRFSVTPLYSLSQGKLLPSGGVSIGYAF